MNIFKIIFAYFKKKKGAFTLIELVIVIGIVATLSVVGAGFYATQHKAKTLETTAREIASYLKYAQQKSMAQEQGLQWGVHFENPVSGNDFYALYKGVTYTTPIETRYLPGGITFQTPTAGNSIDVPFNKLTGFSNTRSITIQNTNNATKTISIFQQGLITY